MPSLSIDSPFDTFLKKSLIKDALRILDLKSTFKKDIINYQRAVSQKRISGKTDLPIKVVFDPDIETAIANTTQWRQIYPCNNTQVSIDIALQQSKCYRIGVAIESKTSKIRRENRISQTKVVESKKCHMKPREFKPPVKKSIPKPTYISDQIIIIHNDLAPSFINDTEEKERAAQIRAQINKSQEIKMSCYIRSIINTLSPLPPLIPNSTKEPKTIQKSSSTKVVIKPLVYNKQYLFLNDL